VNDAPRPGDIGLTSIDGEVGRLIRLGQWLNGTGFNAYQHAFVVVSESETPVIVEAEPDRARLAPLSQYDGRGVVYLRCPAERRRAVAEAARSLLGTPYSFLDYASLAARRLHIPAPHLRAYIAGSGHMICSQLADEAAQRGGWHLFDDGRWPGDVTPGDLYRLVRERIHAMTEEIVRGKEEE
jgi:hypothetical protein